MKKIVTLSLLLWGCLSAFSQTDFRCTCLDIFAEELEAVDLDSVGDLEDHIGEVFTMLKAKNTRFKTCSDHLSLSFSFWTKSKLNIFLSGTRCAYSEKVKKMLEAGPLIYEMDFHVEKLIKEAHEADSIQLITNNVISQQLSSDLLDYLNASLMGDGETFCEMTPDEYLNLMGKASFMTTIATVPQMLKERNISVTKLEPVPMQTFLKQGNIISTVTKAEAEYSVDGNIVPKEEELLAVSYDGGAHWKFVRLENERLIALSGVMDYINPFALQEKVDDEKAADFPAENPEELGTYFCDCMNENKDEDFMKMIECMNILKIHSLWEEREDRKAVYQYVKENCEKHAGNMIFSGLDRE